MADVSSSAVAVQKGLAADTKLLLQTIFRIINPAMNNVAAASRDTLPDVTVTFEDEDAKSAGYTFGPYRKPYDTRPNYYNIRFVFFYRFTHLHNRLLGGIEAGNALQETE